MMNIDLPQKFNSPYKSLTIIEFWKRWHMTLTRFFTKYIFIPLGGSRRGQLRTALNTMFVFLVSGLWHGANWTFVLWGALHGIFNVLTKLLKKFFDRLHPILNWSMTFLFVNITWIFFRAENISDALKLIANMGTMNFGPINGNIFFAFNFNAMESIFESVIGRGFCSFCSGFYLIGFMAIAFGIILGCKNTNEKKYAFYPTYANFLFTIILLVQSILSRAGISSFLYFNF